MYSRGDIFISESIYNNPEFQEKWKEGRKVVPLTNLYTVFIVVAFAVVPIANVSSVFKGEGINNRGAITGIICLASLGLALILFIIAALWANSRKHRTDVPVCKQITPFTARHLVLKHVLDEFVKSHPEYIENPEVLERPPPGVGRTTTAIYTTGVVSRSSQLAGRPFDGPTPPAYGRVSPSGQPSPVFGQVLAQPPPAYGQVPGQPPPAYGQAPGQPPPAYGEATGFSAPPGQSIYDPPLGQSQYNPPPTQSFLR